VTKIFVKGTMPFCCV